MRVHSQAVVVPAELGKIVRVWHDGVDVTPEFEIHGGVVFRAGRSDPAFMGGLGFELADGTLIDALGQVR